MKNFPILFIFQVLIVSCNIFSPEITSEYSKMKLVFTRDNEIWLYNMMNEELEKLIAMGDTIWTEESGFSFTRLWSDQARWSTDGKEIVFLEAVGTDGANLKVLNIETGEQRFFSNHVYRQDATPEWSTDGTKIVFAKSIVHLGLNYEIFIVDAGGENETQLTELPLTTELYPTLDYTSQKIVFMSEDSISTSQLFSMNIDGSNIKQLTFTEETYRSPHMHPQFSPLRDELIFLGKENADSYRDIWKVENMDFSNPIQLTNTELIDFQPSWSNEGELIVFTRFAGNTGPFSHPEIWMMNADGSEQRMIIENGSSSDLWVN